MTSIQIKALYQLDEMQPAVELQRLYWGDSAEALVPAHMLFSIAASGGHVLAAVDDDRMVGVLIGLLGTDTREPDRPAMSNLRIVSKRMVVLPEYRNEGIGAMLKLAQRDYAIRQGIRLVTWTFDPLLSRNAYFNVRKLGAVCSEYLVNYFGTTDDGSGLVQLGASDRLLVDWWVTSQRVKSRVNNERGGLNLAQYLDGEAVIVNPAQDGPLPRPTDSLETPLGAFALLEIPPDFSAVISHDHGLARAWQEHVRVAFRSLMRAGFIVTDVLHEQVEGRERTFYVLSLDSGLDTNLS